jgi:reverse gyrase
MVEENRVNFCKALSGKTLCSVLYCMYIITLKELKGLVKRSIFVEESSNTEVTEEQPNEDFQEVRRRKRHSTVETAKTVKKMAVQTKTSPIVINSPPKEVITQNFFAPPSS